MVDVTMVYFLLFVKWIGVELFDFFYIHTSRVGLFLLLVRGLFWDRGFML